MKFVYNSTWETLCGLQIVEIGAQYKITLPLKLVKSQRIKCTIYTFDKISSLLSSADARPKT